MIFRSFFLKNEKNLKKVKPTIFKKNLWLQNLEKKIWNLENPMTR